MTRDGDVIEIGCHSGSKTWTLTCENNKWIGVIGYCGENSGRKIDTNDDDVIKTGSANTVLHVSPSMFTVLQRDTVISNFNQPFKIVWTVCRWMLTV